uniref:Uncharacterized protein n=1 Tax=Macaca fascicularis TaxID=9541 RepID=A0A7N9CP66_MACFA
MPSLQVKKLEIILSLILRMPFMEFQCMYPIDNSSLIYFITVYCQIAPKIFILYI